MRPRNTLGRVAVAAWLANAAWSTLCVHTALTHLRQSATRNRVGPNTASPDARCSIVVVVPMLHEADRASDCVDHWCKLLDSHAELRLCVVTTERERRETPTGTRTWDTVTAAPAFRRAQSSGRAEVLHYPRVNRTYGEQLGWALDTLTARDPAPEYLYLANVDSRLPATGCAEIVDLARTGVDVAQQSAVFFANLPELGPLATAEAFYQSRWTFEHEVFRFLAGGEELRWLPRWFRDRWYQHTVGHGLLISRATYALVAGLPRPRYGLEDAALGFAIRARGRQIHPFTTLECGDAPRSIRELQRQRSTWIRGPICAPEYARSRRDVPLAAQGLYGGLKWALGLPIQAAIVAMITPRQRGYAVVGWLLGLYGPLVRLLTGLPSLDIAPTHRPRPVHIVTAVAAYPAAAVSCWIGGLRGLCRLAADLGTGRTPVQQRTRETAAS